MRKIKLYLDTSVVSHLRANDTPEKMRDTLRLWDDIKLGKYDVYISDVTLGEIMDCGQPKQDIMLTYLQQISYKVASLSEESAKIAAKIVELGILKGKNRDDCRHIGAAIASSCDYIVSWNFKHMVNIKTVRGVRAITNLFDYPSIDIIQPSMLVQGDDTDD